MISKVYSLGNWGNFRRILKKSSILCPTLSSFKNKHTLLFFPFEHWALVWSLRLQKKRRRKTTALLHLKTKRKKKLVIFEISSCQSVFMRQEKNCTSHWFQARNVDYRDVFNKIYGRAEEAKLVRVAEPRRTVLWAETDWQLTENWSSWGQMIVKKEPCDWSVW